MNAKLESNHPHTKGANARHAMMHSLAEQSGKVVEDVRTLGRMAAKGAGQNAANLRKKGRRALKAGVERARKAKQSFDHFVENHPIRSLLIALGIGAVVGFALRRRSNRPGP